MSIVAEVMLATVLAQVGGLPATKIDHDVHRKLTEDSTLNVDASDSKPALQALVEIGARNHIPMGILLGENLDVCSVSLGMMAPRLTAGQLVVALNARVTGYHANVENGVIHVLPNSVPLETAKLLGMRLAQFESDPDQISMLGVKLWMFIRSSIAPMESTGFAGASAIDAETVPSIKVKNKSVEEILDSIVGLGHGGIWFLNSGLVVTLNSLTPKPYEVYGYVGQEQFVESVLHCPKKGGP